MKKKPSKAARTVLVLGCILFALLLVVFCAALIVDRFVLGDAEVTFPTDHYIFEPADYETDILSDPGYLDLARTLMYSNGAETYPLTGTGFEVAEGAEIFTDYVDALVHGDADALNSLYTDGYFEENDPHAPFTMQRVYDITVTFLGYELNEDGTYAGTQFALDYKIALNSGTFRRDIESDASRTQYFTMVRNGEDFLIDKVSFFPPDA